MNGNPGDAPSRLAGAAPEGAAPEGAAPEGAAPREAAMLARRKSDQEPSLRKNVRTISEMEDQALRSRSAGERVGDAVVKRVGNLTFALIHTVALVAWVVFNAGWGFRTFDPFPYPLLTLVLSVEAIILCVFILISENRMTRASDRRAQLELQIDLLAEQESTKILRLLHRICDHLGIEPLSDPEIRELEARTDPKQVMREIANNFPTVDSQQPSSEEKRRHAPPDNQRDGG